MGGILLPREDVTLVESVDGKVVITQYEDDETTIEIGKVILTNRQFEEIYNCQKHILKVDE